MKSSDFSPQFSEVWGENASSDTITFPIPSTTTTSGRASLDAGFTSVNMTVLAAGGIPPFGQDFNGILKMLSTSARNYESGNVPAWSSAFSTEIGGYPQYALVQYGGTYYASSTDDNTTTPGASGSEWTDILGRYVKQYTDDETYDVSQIGINKATGDFVAYADGAWQNFQPAGDYATKTSISQFYPCTGSTTLSVPSWATRFEYFLTGGGGGGGGCQATGSSLPDTNASAGGGGSGATSIGVIEGLASGGVISVTIGEGGDAGNSGGTSSVAYSGTTYATAGGGGGASFTSTSLSAGGSPGSASTSNGVSVAGASGSDGQNGTMTSFGNGGASYWGGGGRGGARGGLPAAAFGAGGGGAYDQGFTGTFYAGGSGAAGFLLYRWLP